MPYATGRLMIFDRYDNPIGDLPPSALASRPRRVEEVNGEHSLTITTLGPCSMLEKDNRVLWQDGTGKWHEWVVDEVDEDHDFGEYLCVWSLQKDLTSADTNERWASAEPGGLDPIPAATALSIAISDAPRWEVGTVSVTTTGACSFYDQQVWDNLSDLVEKFGGELDAEISVGLTGVVSRRVALLAHVGKTVATRRFDYGADLTGVKRTEGPGPRWCGIRPRGGSAKTDAAGVDYSARIGIEAYAGTPYIYDDEVDPETGVSVKELNRVPDGNGGWAYPCKTVIYNQEVEGVADRVALARELYEMALPDLHSHTRPAVSYSADVLQLAMGGLDPRGVCVGDEVHIVDRTFAGGAGLRLPGRVLRIEGDLPIGEAAPNGPETLTLGQIGQSLADRVRDIARAVTGDVDSRVKAIEAGGTIVYLEHLLDQVNSELNTTGGWEYKVAGQGTYWYDRAVSDPSVGSEATRAIHIGGGFVRFANSRTSSGDWDWTNVITADGYLGLAATIANITTGRIGSADGSFFIDLDNDEIRMGTGATIGESTAGDLVTDVDVEYADSQSATTAPAEGWSTTAPAWQDGHYIWQRTKTTTADGNSACSEPVMISGKDGQPGAGVTVSKIEYGTSASASAQPASWSTTAPSAVAKGTWLWVRTTYSDGSTATAKSYAGTDGEDGRSVSIGSVEKRGGTTTVTILDSDGTPQTLTIEDGADGPQGTPGAAGWVHVAWATSADGSEGFSTTVSANKTYVGIYTDQTQADSQTYTDYSWSLIKGADGADGLNQATVLLYRRSASRPDAPAAQTTYTFATKTLSGSYAPWSTEIPDADGNPCWVTAATASSSGASDTIAAGEWADVTKLVEDGEGGSDGLNQATIYLYRRGGDWRVIGESLASIATGATFSAGDMAAPLTVSGEDTSLPSMVPSPPSTPLAYTFATGALAGPLEGWSRTIPHGDGAIWVTSAVAISSEGTDTIAPTEWSGVAKLAEDGTNVSVGLVQYAVSSSGSEAPETGWRDSVPEASQGQWLWVRTTYSDGTHADSVSYVGTDGTDGLGVFIQSTSKSDGVTTITFTDTNGSAKTVEIADGEDGSNGTPGAAGYTHIAWATSADGTEGFSTSVSAGKTHVGMYADHTEADSQDPGDYSWSLIKGADGTSITVTSVATSYAASASGTTIPGEGWQASVPAVAQGQYLWTRVVVTYSDRSTATSHSAARQGADGTSPTATSTDVGYQQSTSGTSVPSGTWTSTPPAAAAGQYMWTRTTVTYSDRATSVSYSVAYNGADGTAAYAYSVSADPAALVRAESGALAPSQVTFSATRAQGTGNPSAYAGRLVISEYDGASWADKYTSAANEPSKAYAPTATAKVVRCTLYLAGGTTTPLDTQSVPVVSNGATGPQGPQGAQGDKGAKGDDGLNHATVYLFKRHDEWRVDGTDLVASSSSSAAFAGEDMATRGTVMGEDFALAAALGGPTSPTTYSFPTAALTGDLDGWSRTVPDGVGTVWVISADAVSADASVQIPASAWSTPARLTADGMAGTGVAGIEVAYGSTSGPATEPLEWRADMPELAPGEWLWIRTTYAYTDGDTTSSVSKTYVGTDGEDGSSVYVKESSKSGGVTTVTLIDGSGEESTITIEDGQDGSDGTPGASGYVHTAWANSADGTTDFSTTVSANKMYLGVYTDNTAADSPNPSAYSWSLIKGADGTSVTVSKIEYGTSDSASTAPSSYSTTVPTSIAKGRWLWVKTTYSDSSTATSKTYVGTDGQDGTSVYVTSSSKRGKTTTVNLSDGTELTIVDGTDGTNGTPGANGYVHTAWANSSDGSADFSTTDSANKQYLGVYTDNTAADSTRYQDYSWSRIKGEQGAKGDQGSKGDKGDAGTDGYTVMLTNESHTFAASTAAAIAGSTTSQVIAFKGSAQVPATIGTITGAPSGMTAVVSGNGTTSAYFTVTVTTSLTSRQGTLTVPVTVDGKQFSLRFSWTLALTGAKGDTGADGMNQATVYLYQRTNPWEYVQNGERLVAPPNTMEVSGENATMDGIVSDENFKPSESPAPALPAETTTYTFATSTLDGNLNGWSQDIPDGDGTIWVTTTRAASDAATSTIGASSWATSSKLATNGHDGVGISSIEEQYYLSSSASNRTGGSWVATPPTYVAGYYYWTRSKIAWNDGTTTYTDPVLSNGVNAANSAAVAASSTLADYITTNGAIVTSLKEQVDGAVDIWYGIAEPDATNLPWDSPGDSEIHVGDLYYDTETGRAFRFVESGNSYAWEQLPDEAAANALASANTAQATADGKRRVFTSQPSVPYDVGDLWVDGSCVKYARAKRTATGSFSSSDWVATATDDTAANAAAATAASLVDGEKKAREDAVKDLSGVVSDLSEGFTLTKKELTMAIADAARGATDYLTFQDGTLYIGATDSAVRAALSNSLFSFETNAGTICYFGMNASDIWEMYIQTASVKDRLSFGDFSWIARQNGNMTLKWVGQTS